jgi:hypothetical protein
MTTFMIRALPAGEPDSRAQVGRQVIADGPYPCRRCLSNADMGDHLQLLPYDPFTVESPYAGEGPIFVHADGCQPSHLAPGELPEQVHGRVLSVRSYDQDAMMLAAEVVPGEQLGECATRLLEQPAAFLHVHFAGPGCFAFRVEAA